MEGIMPYVGDAPSIVDDIANEIVNDIPAPIRDHEGFESNDTYVSSREATALAGTAMQVEGHPDTELTFADLVGDPKVSENLVADMFEWLAVE